MSPRPSRRARAAPQSRDGRRRPADYHLDQRRCPTRPKKKIVLQRA
jgi:hypothetical protein